MPDKPPARVELQLPMANVKSDEVPQVTCFSANVQTVIEDQCEFLKPRLRNFIEGGAPLASVVDEAVKFITKQCPSWARDPAQATGLRSLLLDELPQLLSQCLENEYWEFAKDALISEGFGDFLVNSQSVSALVDFAKEFDLSRRAPEGWMTGSDLRRRWGLEAKDLIKHAKFIPVFLFSRVSNEWVCVTDRIPWPLDVVDYQRNQNNPRLWKWSGESVPCPWYCLPMSWKVDPEHAAFHEKLPLTSGNKPADASKTWLTFKELVKRWRTTPYRVEESVLNRGLPAYHLDRNKGIVASDDDYLSFPFPAGKPIKQMCLYKIDVVRAFERNNKKFLGINERSLDRIQAQELVTEWVRENPTLRTGDVVEMLRGTGHFDHLGRDETLAEYVRHLINNHTPGPRKKS